MNLTPSPTKFKLRLEYLRGELRTGRMSYEEQSELQCLIPHIEPGDMELLEAAGVPEELAHLSVEDRMAAIKKDSAEKRVNAAAE